MWCETKSGDTQCGARKDGGKDRCADARVLPGDSRTEAPDNDELAPLEPQKPDLLVDTATVLQGLESRSNGYTYVPVELHIANAGSAKTTKPFHLSSSYYDYQDDVGSASYIVPSVFYGHLEAGEVVSLTVDVAVPFPDGFESPFQIRIELDSCSSADADVDTQICRIPEENEVNNGVDLDL